MRDGICIEISDNGVGMEAGEVERLLSDRKREEFSEIGIANVQDRFRHCMGKKYGVAIFSQPGCGTTVEVHFALYIE